MGLRVKYFLPLLRMAFILCMGPSFSLTANDTGKINATELSSIVHVKSDADILAAIKEANNRKLPIVIMGKQHSQGGHTLAPKAIALDMLTFNKVLSIDVKKKQVTVQTGITWGDLQKYINPYNLAIKSMQSPNIFTVGGSLSVNAHGDDFRAGALANSIVSFHILLANEKKLLVKPNEHAELWSAVIGGYGLLGVVTDVTLALTDNNYLISHYEEMDVRGFPDYFRKKILNNKKNVFFYAHLNIVPNAQFLQKMYVITYQNTDQVPKKIIALDNPDKWNPLLTPVFNISRHGDLGKALRFKIERKIFSRFYQAKTVTRNNAMQKPVRFAADYQSKKDVDWLQEYFIPVDKLSAFINVLGPVILKNKVNLLNVTIRYVPLEKNILLSYAKADSFAVVLYFNQELSPKKIEQAKSFTRILINAALSANGNYYLPYQAFATPDQFRKGYPEYKQFLKIKKVYDPKDLFRNEFSAHYLGVRFPWALREGEAPATSVKSITFA